LREFAFGQRTLDQLRSEPQAQAGRDAAGSTQSSNAAVRGGAENTTTSQGNQASSQAGTPPNASPAQSAQASAQLAGALLGMDPSTHMLVRQQLEALANQAF